MSAAVAAAPLALMDATQGFRLFPEGASTMSGRVDALFLLLVGISAFVSLLIFGTILVFSVRYRRRSGTAPVQIEGSNALEAAWSIIPLLVFMVFFGWGAVLYFENAQPPPDAMNVYVIGKQWMWKIYHDNGKGEINTLHAPVGRPVRLTMTSQDVIHSFYVPAFREKMDVLPGRYTTLWFQATRTGEFHLFCAEYCGARHSLMTGSVVVMEPHEYQRWLAGETGMTLQERGADLFSTLGCRSCHQAGRASRGPELKGLFGRTVHLVGGGTLTAGEAYIRESIMDPREKVVEGYRPVMPTFEGRVDEEDVLALIAYIKELSE